MQYTDLSLIILHFKCQVKAISEFDTGSDITIGACVKLIYGVSLRRATLFTDERGTREQLLIGALSSRIITNISTLAEL